MQRRLTGHKQALRSAYAMHDVHSRLVHTFTYLLVYCVAALVAQNHWGHQQPSHRPYCCAMQVAHLMGCSC